MKQLGITAKQLEAHDKIRLFGALRDFGAIRRDIELCITNALKMSIPGAREYSHVIKMGHIATKLMDTRFLGTQDGFPNITLSP